MVLIIFMALVGGNEFARLNKWTGLLMFLVLPVILTIVVWPNSATADGSSVNDWFHYAKVYSSLAGCLGFWCIRYIPGLDKKKWALCFPPLILAINICEAVARDFQVYGWGFFNNFGVMDGMRYLSGPWNVMNGIAGILNIITICGWFGIIINNKEKSRDMLWPDMLWLWIIAYDLWNFAYTYNCLGDHSWYCGIALLASCTFAAFFIKKGAWLQHRAATLAIWCMIAQTIPTFIDSGTYAVKASLNPTALFIISLAALASNVAAVCYEVYHIKKSHGNPITGEVFTHTKPYQEVKSMPISE